MNVLSVRMRLVLSVVMSLIALALFHASGAPRQVTLRFKAEPGTLLIYSLRSEMESSVGTRHDEMTLEMRVTQEVLYRRDGYFHLKVTYQPIRATLNGQELKREAPRVLYVTVNEFGNPLRVSGLSGAEAKLFKLMTSNRIPERALTEGETWSEEVALPGPTGDLIRLRATHTLKGIARCQSGQECAVIYSELRSLTPSVTYEGWSEMLFDLQQGVIVFLSSEVNIKAFLKLRDGSVAPLKVKDAVRISLIGRKLRGEAR